jgi:hypothetical protein
MKKLIITFAGLAIAGLSLTACGSTTTVTRNVPGPVVTKTVPGPVVTKTVIKTVKVKVTAAAPAAAAAVPAPIKSTAPAVPFTCAVMSGMGGATNLEARVWGPETYSGPIFISFSDGSGDGFPGLSGEMSDGLAWVPIPPADVGASAEPSQCSVSS